MENIKRAIKYQILEAKGFLIGLWTILIIVDIAFYVLNGLGSPDYIHIGFSLGTTEGITYISVVGVNLMAILISLLVYSYTSNYESFPLAISLSMTRKEYFLSLIVDNIFVAFLCALIQAILFKIDPYFVKLVGKNPLYDFAYFNIQTDNIIYIIFILFTAFLSFMCFWNFISSINYKIGYKMWLILVGFNILVSILRIDLFENIFNAIGNVFLPRLTAFQILIILGAMIVTYGLNYLVVKRTDIKKRLG